MPKVHKALLTGIILTLLITNKISVHAQFYNGSQLNFGKNRVQFSDRFWSFMRFDHFDTYFYLNGKELAVYTAKYADKYLKEIESKLEYTLEDKIQFIIYNKFSELQESNIGLISDVNYNIGGVTHIVGTKVFLYFNGSHTDFEKQIRAGMAQVIIDEMMYGGKLTAMIKNSALLSLPAWYSQGLISYISEEWNTQLDNHVKDGILRGAFKRYNSLSGDDAVYAGHSIWKYVADKYGPSAITNIVYLTKVSRNVESGFLYVLGVSFKNLSKEWLAYYEQQYTADDQNRQRPGETALLKKFKKNTAYGQAKISPDGKYAAYTTNFMGQYRIWLFDLEKNKTRQIFKRECKLDEKIDYSYPLLAWHPTGKMLAIVLESKGKIMMYSYMMDENKFEKQQLFNLEKILDLSFSQNGKMIVFSGVVQGQSDIYVYSVAAHTYEPITKDIYDDLNPRFVNNSSEIIFSSNRIDDTIRYDVMTFMDTEKDTISQLPSHTDIFIYDYRKKEKLLRRLTNTEYTNEIMPMQYDNRFFTYLSDENGIFNRYLARIDSTISYIDTTTHYRYYTTSFAASDYNRNILEQDIAGKAGKSAEVIFSEGKYKIFFQDLPIAKDIKKTNPTNTFNRTIYLKNQQEKAVQDNSLINTEEIEKIKSRKNKSRYPKNNNVLIDQLDNAADTGKVDINNYIFSNEQKYLNAAGQDSSLQKKKTFTLPRQQNYNVEYSINQLVGQIDFNYLNTMYQQFTGGNSPIFLNPGLNVSFQLGVIDLLEDYRISGGISFSLSFDNNEFFIGFENLKKKLDHGLFYYRQANTTSDEYSIIKLRSNSLFYVMKWPFSRVLAVKGTLMARYDKKIYASTDVYNLKQPNINEYWAGAKTELVYDNTRFKAINIYYGWRWKIFGEYYQMINKKFNNLVVLGFDFRHYQKIHRTFIWANRLAASTSFGNNKLVYYMGGVDTWIIPKFNNDNQVSQTQNYAYQTLATNMRGFIQNARNGPTFAVLNSELRFPIVRYFSKKPLKNNFLTNLQIIGFGDLGTAWVGTNPYSEENTLAKQVIQRGPLQVTLIKKRDPLIGGFGVGLRTKLLGYFIRADYAWGVENGIIQKPVFYISLSTDF
ncbi:MAG TPA: hypothetical protein PKW80_08775 [Bacteroidales bacterium]|nr:hypothetical protein [Bacteroidales bacterium]